MGLIMTDPVQWVCEHCATKEDVKYYIKEMQNLYNNWEDEEVEELETLHKYLVHYGVRITKDYCILAHDREEAIEIAETIFQCEEFNNMEYADSDVDAWEDDTILDDELDAKCK